MGSATDTGPLDWRIAITDQGGRPTPEFQRRWNTQRNNNGLIGTATGNGPPSPDPIPGNGATYVDTSTTPGTLYVGFNGDWVQVSAVTFTQLQDTPDNYTGSAGKLVHVNGSANGLEFTSLAAALDVLGATQGDILYRSATGWVSLPPGTSGEVLTTGGTGANPDWAPAAASGVTSYFGIGAPSTTHNNGDLYFDTTASPYTEYVQNAGAWSPVAGGGGGGGFSSIANLYTTNQTPGTVSASAFAFKGNIYIPSENISVIALWGLTMAFASGGTYVAAVCRLSGTGSTGITTVGSPIFSTSTTIATTLTETLRFEFPSPVVLTSGVPYALMIGRTDQTGTFALPVQSLNTPSGAMLPGRVTFNARIASTTIPNGTTVDTNSGGGAGVYIGYEMNVSTIAAGVTSYFGTGAPSTLHTDGDLYFDTTNTPYTEYVQNSGAWVLVGNGDVSGTWSPVLRFGGSNTGITYTTQEGSYRTSGNFVFASLSLVLSNKGSATGAATISLPIAPASGKTFMANVLIDQTSSISAGNFVQCLVRSGVLNLYLASAGNITSLILDANFTNTTEVQLSVVYHT